MGADAVCAWGDLESRVFRSPGNHPHGRRRRQRASIFRRARSSVWMNRRVPRNAISIIERSPGRAVPDQRRPAPPHGLGSLREFDPVPVDPSPVEGPSWVHCRIPWLLGRPSPTCWHANSGRDGCGRVPRDRRWSRCHPRSHARVHDQQEWDMSCTYAAHVPILPIMGGPEPELISTRRSDGHTRQTERDHRRSSGTQQRVTSGTGVPVRRERPSARPRGSVVMPTPATSTKVRGRGGRVCHTGGRGWWAKQVATGRERRAKATFHSHVDLMGLTDAAETQGVDMIM
jgi:hypothetical protein